MLERTQRVCLKVLLGEMYIDHMSALEMCSVSLLSDRRDQRLTNFCKKAISHPKHKNMFPLSDTYLQNTCNIRNPEKYKVIFSYGDKYKPSCIPHSQRKLNEMFRKKQIN